MSAPVILENIDKHFGKVQALKAISLEIAEGELFGLIGPDGAGKTTLFRIMNSLMLPDAGKATILGYNTVKDYKAIRKQIGYMPGKFSLYQDLTVTENLQFFATIFGTTLEENYHLIRDIYVQIEPFKDRFAGKLSGGMKQKLALCCALIHAPEILFLDEPTTGVDPVSRKELWEMLDRLKRERITIVVSTPYMDEAERCDRIALMQHGSLLSINTPKQITGSFSNTLLSISAVNKPQLIRDLRAFPSAGSVFPFGESIHYTDVRQHLDQPVLEEIANYLLEKGHSTVSVVKANPNIEDVFMKLMQDSVI